MIGTGKRGIDLAISGTLAVMVAISFSQAVGNDFVVYDDLEYIYGNNHVRTGLSWENVKWAFTSGYAANWHPVTWLSHMVDTHIWGLDAAWHHTANLVFHGINVLLLFHLFRSMTNHRWRSSLVAALFAVHPLHVESVAWVAERKDLLSTFFMLLAMRSYYRYVRDPRGSRYILTLFFFTIGLMAKPMIITFPILLLLLDYWPLDRFGQKSPAPSNRDNRSRLLMEKMPFFALSAVSSIVTYIVQREGGAVQNFVAYPLEARLLNGIASYGQYIWKTLAPVGLAVIYPHPGDALSLWKPAAGACLLLGGFTVSWRYRKKSPWILTGWLWYVVTLVPVIGIVQVGFQAMADRYTYIPLIGIFLIMAWSIPERFFSGGPSRVIAACVGIVLVLYSFLTYRQCGFWRNSITLFERALAVTENNFVALDHLGLAYLEERENEKAILYFEASLGINPRNYGAFSNLGTALLRLGKKEEAVANFKKALTLKPDYAVALNNLGLAFFLLGQYDDALLHYTKSLAIAPDNAALHDNFGAVFLRQGKFHEAESSFRRAISLNPEYAEAHYDLAEVLKRRGRVEEAKKHYIISLELKPDFTLAREKLQEIILR